MFCGPIHLLGRQTGPAGQVGIRGGETTESTAIRLEFFICYYLDYHGLLIVPRYFIYRPSIRSYHSQN